MNNQSVEPDLEQGRRFLKLLDPDADTHCFQTFDDSPLKRGSLARTLIGGHAKPLIDLQADGAGVFFAVNAIKGRRRLADKVTRVRAVFVDLDGAPLQPVLACGLEPHAIIESSPGRFHAYWMVDNLPRDQFRSVQRAIAKRFGGDPSVIDLCRVMRLPGFYHLKGEPFQTRLHQVEQRLPYTAEQILAEFPPQAETRKKPNGSHAETPFTAINGAALANLDAWVPKLFPTARRSGKRWRVSSADLGQGYEEDLSITSDGAKHFGVHDMGDPRQGKRTPIDLVMEYGGAPHVAAAGRWLAGHLGIGFLEPSIEGKAVADRLLKNAQQMSKTGWQEGDSWAKLMDATFPEPRWALPDLIPEGLTVFAGKQKSGKSWWCLSLAYAVAEQTDFLDRTGGGGDVLLLALEDNPRRIKSRINIMGLPRASRVAIYTTWPTGEEGMGKLLAWMEKAADPRLIIIDTIRRFTGPSPSRENSYERDVTLFSPLQKAAAAARVAIVGVTHTKKDTRHIDHWQDAITGSAGLPSVADAVILLTRETEGIGAILRATGRDLAEVEMPLSFHKKTCTWRTTEETIGALLAKIEGTAAERRMLDALRKIGEPVSVKTLAECLGRTMQAVRHLLGKMHQRGAVEKMETGTDVLWCLK